MLIGCPLPMSPIVFPITLPPAFKSATGIVTIGLQAYAATKVSSPFKDANCMARMGARVVCGQLFSSLFSSTSTEQISPIPPDLSPVSIRLALLFLLIYVTHCRHSRPNHEHVLAEMFRH
jgi:hypothetical protein